MSEEQPPMVYTPTINAAGNPIGMIDGHLGGYFVEYLVDDKKGIITSGANFHEEFDIDTDNFDDVLNEAWSRIVDIQEPQEE